MDNKPFNISDLAIGKLYVTPWKINHGGYIRSSPFLESPISLEDGEIIMLLDVKENSFIPFPSYISDSPKKAVVVYHLTVVSESGKVGNIEISESAIKFFKLADKDKL